jgi:hypothetical protein
MRLVLWQSGSVVAPALVALSAAAHHSPNIYDQQRNVTMQGVVTRYDWANPHVYLYIEAPSADGEPVVWELENGPTTMMKRRGWSRDSYVAGDRVIVHGNPARDPLRKAILVTSIEKTDRTLYSREGMAEALSVSEGPRAQAESLSGIWAVPLSTNQRFSDPSSWPLTEEGAEALASYDDVTMNPQLQCLSRTAPWVMIFPGVHMIEVGERIVSIRSEYDTVERTVHMDVATHEGAALTHQGHSIGRWDGEVLVVDTTRFADHRNGNARGVPSGAQKHLIERFELDPDRRSLTYRFELRDPEYLGGPITGEMQWGYRPDIDFVPVECALENAHRFVGD